MMPSSRRPAPQRGGPRAIWTAAALIVPALVAVTLYAPVLGFDFVRDDRQLILDNPFMRVGGYLGRLLLSDFWASAGGNSGLWRPLAILSFWLDGRLGGWTPGIRGHERGEVAAPFGRAARSEPPHAPVFVRRPRRPSACSRPPATFPSAGS